MAKRKFSHIKFDKRTNQIDGENQTQNPNSQAKRPTCTKWANTQCDVELDRRILFDCFVVVVAYIFSKIHNQKDFLIYAVLAFYISIRLVDRIHIYAFVAKVEAMCSEKQQLTNSPKLETNCKIQ